MTHAIHARNGANHIVGFSDLHVLITEDKDGWCAQGVEIDYFACGDTFDELRRRFEDGLIDTFKAHIDKYHKVDKFLKWAPSNVLSKLKDADAFSLDMMATHAIEDEELLKNIPFKTIAYLKESPAPAR